MTQPIEKNKANFKKGCLGCLGGLVVFFVITGVIGSLTHQPTTKTAITQQQETQPVIDANGFLLVGYLKYKVYSTKWVNSLGSGMLVEKPDAKFLVVSVEIENTDSTERMIPEPHLEDTEGSIYKTTQVLAMQEKSFLMVSLNPHVKKKGVFLFDVPPDRKYSLVLEGGFMSSEAYKIELK